MIQYKEPTKKIKPTIKCPSVGTVSLILWGVVAFTCFIYEIYTGTADNTTILGMFILAYVLQKHNSNEK